MVPAGATVVTLDGVPVEALPGNVDVTPDSTQTVSVKVAVEVVSVQAVTLLN